MRHKQEEQQCCYHHDEATNSQQTHLSITSIHKQAHYTQVARRIASVLLLISISANIATAAMNLPDGIENVLGFVPKSSFQCERDGYFGDVENDCRIFHLCQKQIHSNGRTEWRHWTYACGNQTMFNQLTLTCAFIDEAIPCRHAPQFQYLNEVIHRPLEPFLTDADVTSGFSYYSNRIMSDGARARAFEDSHLMAQLGGSNQHTQPKPQTQPQQQQPRQQQHQQQASHTVDRRQQQVQHRSVNQAPQQQNQNLNQNQNQNWFIANRFGDSRDQNRGHNNLQSDANRLFEPFFANQHQHQQRQQSTSNRIIENRLFQIQHNNNNNNNNQATNFALNQPQTFPPFQTQAQPQQRPQQRQQQVNFRPQQQQQQPPVAPTTTTTTTSTMPTTNAVVILNEDRSNFNEPLAPATSTINTSNKNNNQAPQSFAFTLTTDHRLGSSNVHHSQQQQQQQPQFSGNLQPSTAQARQSFNTFRSSSSTGSASPQQTTTRPTLVEFTTTSSPTTETVPTTQLSQLAPTESTTASNPATTAAFETSSAESPSTTTTAPSASTSAAPSTTEATTTTTEASTTTTVASSTTTSVAPVASGRQRRRQQSGNSSGQISATRWQSTRLSGPAAAAARQERQSRQEASTPVLMRRHVQLPVRSDMPIELRQKALNPASQNSTRSGQQKQWPSSVLLSETRQQFVASDPMRKRV